MEHKLVALFSSPRPALMSQHRMSMGATLAFANVQPESKGVNLLTTEVSNIR